MFKGVSWTGADLGCSDKKRITKNDIRLCPTLQDFRRFIRSSLLIYQLGVGARAEAWHRLTELFSPVLEALGLQPGGETWEQRYPKSHSPESPISVALAARSAELRLNWVTWRLLRTRTLILPLVLQLSCRVTSEKSLRVA